MLFISHKIIDLFILTLFSKLDIRITSPVHPTRVTLVKKKGCMQLNFLFFEKIDKPLKYTIKIIT